MYLGRRRPAARQVDREHAARADARRHVDGAAHLSDDPVHEG